MNPENKINIEEWHEYIIENSHLFWWIPDAEKQNLSIDTVIEAILNFGNIESVKKLFAIIGISKVADIFYTQINSARCSYFPQTKNFFNLYFQRYA